MIPNCPFKVKNLKHRCLILNLYSNLRFRHWIHKINLVQYYGTVQHNFFRHQFVLDLSFGFWNFIFSFHEFADRNSFDRHRSRRRLHFDPLLGTSETCNGRKRKVGEGKSGKFDGKFDGKFEPNGKRIEIFERNYKNHFTSRRDFDVRDKCDNRDRVLREHS